jgi:hypothetical protein
MIRLEVTRAHDIDTFGVTPVVLVTVWLGTRPLLRWQLDTDQALDFSWQLQRAVFAPLERL